MFLSRLEFVDRGHLHMATTKSVEGVWVQGTNVTSSMSRVKGWTFPNIRWKKMLCRMAPVQPQNVPRTWECTIQSLSDECLICSFQNDLYSMDDW